ncbi:TatD family hydrolase [Bacteroidota bacterium]
MLRPISQQYIDIHTHKKNCKNFVFPIRNVFSDELDEDLSDSHEALSIGFHPWHIKFSDIEEQFELIEKQLNQPTVFAIGECGIDKAIETDIQLQKEVFVRQVEISEKAQKPLIVHCVKAAHEILQIRKETHAQMPWIFHGFNQSIELAEQIIKQDCYMSFGYQLMQKESKPIDLLKQIDRTRIFYESDDQRITVIDVYETASKILDKYVATLKEEVSENYRKLFHE